MRELTPQWMDEHVHGADDYIRLIRNLERLFDPELLGEDVAHGTYVIGAAVRELAEVLRERGEPEGGWNEAWPAHLFMNETWMAAPIPGRGAVRFVGFVSESLIGFEVGPEVLVRIGDGRILDLPAWRLC